MTNEEYKEYDNPEKAQRVWLLYRKELRRSGLIGEGISIKRDCKTFEELDVRLNELLDNKERARAGIPSQTSIPVDRDATGWGNVVRTVEDTVN